MPGIYKLKRIGMKFGKLLFETDNLSKSWNHDIKIISESKLILECLVPNYRNYMDFSFQSF